MNSPRRIYVRRGFQLHHRRHRNRPYDFSYWHVFVVKYGRASQICVGCNSPAMDMNGLLEDCRFKHQKTTRHSNKNLAPKCEERIAALARFLNDMHIIVFDTETTTIGGTVIQMGIVIAKQDGECVFEYDALWNTDERIHPDAQKIHHISQADLHKRGLDRSNEVEFVLGLFAQAIANNCALIAHNASFDVDVLNRTAHSHGLASLCLQKDDVFCTMCHSRIYCGLMSRNGRLKMPKNEELYLFLFGCPPDGILHNALLDAHVTMKSFVEGRMRGWW